MYNTPGFETFSHRKLLRVWITRVPAPNPLDLARCHSPADPVEADPAAAMWCARWKTLRTAATAKGRVLSRTPGQAVGTARRYPARLLWRANSSAAHALRACLRCRLRAQANCLLWENHCPVAHVQQALLQGRFLRQTNCLLGRANCLLHLHNSWAVHVQHARHIPWMAGQPPNHCLRSLAEVLSE